MKYYGVIGESVQIINETKKPTCPEGYIEMQYERPAPNYIADESGQWVLVDDEVSDDRQ